MAECQAVGFCGGVVLLTDGQSRRARLAVPAFELRQVGTIGVFHRLDEIINGHRLAIVPLEVEIAAFAEALLTQQRLDHAHHFSALLVNGQGVEVGDLDEGFRAHRVGHRAGILGELVSTQVGHILDALDGRRVHVSGELRIAEHGEAFLERQLEPVAASHAVTGPVMEVFMGDDRLDALVCSIGGRFSARQHSAGVEDVEPLVFHCAHVEVVDRDDHEDVQVVLATVGLFVPLHRFLQAVHGVLAFVDVFRLDIDAQRHVATAHGGEAVLDAPEVTGDQGEQIRGFLEGIFPSRPMTPIVFFAAGDRVAVGEKDRIGMLLGADGGGELAHHVRAVEVIGNLAEAFGLALGAEHAAGFVQAFQRGIALRMDYHGAVEGEAGGIGLQCQAFLGHFVVAQAELTVIQRQRNQLEILTVKLQRRQPDTGLRIAPHDQLGMHQGAVFVQLEGQVGFIDQVVRNLIIL